MRFKVLEHALCWYFGSNSKSYSVTEQPPPCAGVCFESPPSHVQLAYVI